MQEGFMADFDAAPKQQAYYFQELEREPSLQNYHKTNDLVAQFEVLGGIYRKHPRTLKVAPTGLTPRLLVTPSFGRICSFKCAQVGNYV